MTTGTNEPQERPSEVDFIAIPVGQTIGRYEITGVLGHGGFGITYRARDSQLGREVAIKEYLPPSLAIRLVGSTVVPRSIHEADDFAWGRARFVDEGRTLGSLQKAPAIVRVYDFLEANGTAYIVMELVHGETLERRLKRKGLLTPTEVDRLMWPLLDGLARVHATGFLHRDIKPANILLDDEGYPTLIDFGASRAAMAGRTSAMTAVFTPGYAAAEQMTSAPQGPWTDIYGFSATLHHAIAGKPPPNVFDRLMHDAYEPLGRLRPAGFARGLLIGIDAGLAVKASDRPQSIAGWRPLLSQTAAATDEATVVSRAFPRPRPRVKSGKRFRVGIAATAAIAAAIGGYFTWQASQGPFRESMRALEEAQAAQQSAEREAAQLRIAAAQRQVDEDARRKAEVDAAAKRRLDDEVRRKAEATAAEKKRLADEARQKAEADERTAAEKKKVEEAEAKARVFDGTYGGSLNEGNSGSVAGARLLSATLRLENRTISGQIVYPRCGTFPVSLAVSPSGEISGNVRMLEVMRCGQVNGTARGRVSSAGDLQLELHGVGTAARGTLVRGRAAPPLSKLEEEAKARAMPSPAPAVPAAPAPSIPAPTASAAPGARFDGLYAGSLSSSTPSGGQSALHPLAMELRIAGGQVVGEMVNFECGAMPISLAVAPSGTISGTLRLYEGNCSPVSASASGRVTGNTLVLEIRGMIRSARGSLTRSSD